MVFRRNCSLSVLSSSPLFSLNSFSLPFLLVFLFFLSFTYHLSFLLSLFLCLPLTLLLCLSPSLRFSFFPHPLFLHLLSLFIYTKRVFLFLYMQNLSPFFHHEFVIKNFCHHSSIFPFYHTILIFFYYVCARFFIYEYFFFLAVLYFFYYYYYVHSFIHYHVPYIPIVGQVRYVSF